MAHILPQIDKPDESLPPGPHAFRALLADLAGKILVDIANPLDFSRGMPPTLWVSNTDSLGEQIQRAFPQARVVMTLNTLNAGLMVNPGGLAGGDHTIFVSGDDATAKAQVSRLNGLLRKAARLPPASRRRIAQVPLQDRAVRRTPNHFGRAGEFRCVVG